MRATRNRSDAYAKALGRLPAAGKAAFIREAIEHLEFMRDVLAKARERWRPTDAHFKALEDMVLCARELKLAMERVEISGVPLEYLREQWSIVVRREGVPDDAFPMNLPSTLSLLAMVVRDLQPEPKRRGGQVKQSPATTVIQHLARAFWRAFGKPATFGSNSPFVKFCEIALPDYGFTAPSAQTIGGIVEVR